MRDTIEMAREAGIEFQHITGILGKETISTMGSQRLERIEQLVALVRADEREACHALRQTLPNPHEHCQVSAHAYDMAISAYGAAIRARGETK